MIRLRALLPLLTRLALALWLAAFALAAAQGCLSLPPHDLASDHAASLTGHADGHAQHASGCLQFCEDGASSLTPSPLQPLPDLQWSALLFLLPALLPDLPLSHTLLTLSQPAPPHPPVWLSFLRLNH